MTNNLTKTLKSLADNVIYAETTLSEYYKIGCIKVRFSDHIANDMDCDLAIFCNTIHKQNVYVIIPMVGTFKEVQWFSNVTDAVDFIIRFESMARIMLKGPVPSDNQAKRQSSNIIAKQIEASEKLCYNDWLLKLNGTYECKKFDFKTLLDAIYAIDPSIKMVDKLKKYNCLKAELKYNAIMAIYNTIKK
jgi:hypothetical protein